MLPRKKVRHRCVMEVSELLACVQLQIWEQSLPSILFSVLLWATLHASCLCEGGLFLCVIAWGFGGWILLRWVAVVAAVAPYMVQGFVLEVGEEV